jgi:hypothetical protein
MLAARVGQRKAAIRRTFIRRLGGDTSSAPPLAFLLQGGRGADARLSLLLSLLWVASGDPYDTRFPARYWAEFLDLPDPAHAGARRISSALRWLEARRLVSIERVPGEQPIVTLLMEDGSGRPYIHPARAQRIGELLPEEHLYVWLPYTFFANGWLAALSARAVAMLLVLRDVQPFHEVVSDTPEENWAHMWITPALARERYALSEDTWTRGTKELASLEIVDVKRRPVGRTFDRRRVRNMYRLHLRVFDSIPGRPTTPETP